MTEEQVAYTLPPYTLYNADVLDDEGQAARVWDFDSIREAVYFACHFRAANPAKRQNLFLMQGAVIVMGVESMNLAITDQLTQTQTNCQHVGHWHWSEGRCYCSECGQRLVETDMVEAHNRREIKNGF